MIKYLEKEKLYEKIERTEFLIHDRNHNLKYTKQIQHQIYP
jgi:hypothetical protein